MMHLHSDAAVAPPRQAVRFKSVKGLNRKQNFFLRTFFLSEAKEEKETTLGVINCMVPYFLHLRVLLEMCQLQTNRGQVNAVWRG